MSIIKKTLRATSLVLWLSALAFGPSGMARGERLPVRTYTSADGLGSSFVSSMMRDRRGFLWFCTRDGLSRFDGARFVTYRVGQGNAPPGIEQILETGKGIYWIVTTGGVYRFDPNAPVDKRARDDERPTLSAELTDVPRGVLFEDSGGRLWLGGSKFYSLEDQGGKIALREVELNLPVNPVAGFIVSSISEGRDGSLWLVTTWGLVRRLPDGREIIYSAEGSRTDLVNSVLEDGDGRIWTGRASGVYVLRPESLNELGPLGAVTLRKLDEVAAVRPAGRVSMPERPGEIFKYTETEVFGGIATKYLYMTSDGHVWVSTRNGLVEYNGQTFIPHTTAQGLPRGFGPMIEDASGNLWVGGTGLMRFDRHGITTYDDSDGLKNVLVLALGESLDGKLYVASEGFFLSLFDGHGFQTIRPQLPPGAAAMWTANPIYQDHAGEWWVLTGGGLYRFAPAKSFEALARERPLAVYTSRDGLKSDLPFHVFEDSKGNLWIGVHGLNPEQGGLSRWDRATGKFQTLTEADNFPHGKSPSSFAEDAKGNLWFGFYEGGLARYAPGGRFTTFTTADGLPDGGIMALHLDLQGRLWAASALGGLSRVENMDGDHPQFINYTTANGLASNNVRSLTEDLYGNIYAGTARGVDRLSRDAASIKHYSTKDGLATDFVNAAFRDRSGALWFGTFNGLSRLVPTVDLPATAPPVWVGGLRIAGESRPLPELGAEEVREPELAHAQNNLQINFFGVDFSAGETLRYQYILEGADRDWSQPTEQRTVNYANLAPGSYRFLVRAVNADGVVSKSPARFIFTILPPFWQRWWFLTGAAVVIALVLFALDRYRANRMRELDAALAQSRKLTAELTEQRSELSRANRALELDYTVTSILAESESSDDAAPRILQAICQSTGWDVGAVWRVDNRSDVLHCAAVWHQPAANAAMFEALSRESVFQTGRGLPGRVWESRKSLWITELAADTNFPRLSTAALEGLHSAFGFPILLEGEVIGVLEFFSRERRERDEELLEMMSTIGGHIGQLIERKRAEEDLRESEDRMRTLAETAADAIITIDEKSRIVFVNPATERVFGYEVSELIGADLTILMPEYLRHLHNAGLARYGETGSRHISWEGVELPGLHKNGHEIPLEISFGEFARDGKRFFTGIARDITERKHAEEALRRAREERLHELERVRKRIATDLHDDIGSSLTQISILSEVVSRQINHNDSPVTKPLSLIANTSRELVDAMSDIVWAINPQKDHLSDLSQRMRHFASNVFTARNIKFSFRVPPAQGDVQLGANVRREVFLIFKESINNLVKHAGCTEAHIEFQVEGDNLSLRVSDNGKGFDTGLESEGHGLMSMSERARGLGGRLEMISEPGQGTAVTLTVPLGQPQLFSSN